MFDINLRDNNEIYLSGRFDASQVEKADKVFDEVKENCYVDFKDLSYISSAGLGSLLKTHVRLNGSGHIVVLRNLNNHVREVFKYSGLDKVFKIE